jgi:hypothetical protein
MFMIINIFFAFCLLLIVDDKSSLQDNLYLELGMRAYE